MEQLSRNGWAPTPPSWLETNAILSQLNKQKQRAIEKYVDFVRAGVGLPSVWHELKNQIYLRVDNFVNAMQDTLEYSGDLKEIPKVQHCPRPKPLAHYAKTYDDQQQAMAVAYLSGGYTMKTIADEFGVHYATVSRAVKNYENSQIEN